MYRWRAKVCSCSLKLGLTKGWRFCLSAVIYLPLAWSRMRPSSFKKTSSLKKCSEVCIRWFGGQKQERNSLIQSFSGCTGLTETFRLGTTFRNTLSFEKLLPGQAFIPFQARWGSYSSRQLSCPHWCAKWDSAASPWKNKPLGSFAASDDTASHTTVSAPWASVRKLLFIFW